MRPQTKDRRDADYSVRATKALRLVEAGSPTGRLTQEEVAARVAEETGEEVDQSLISRWLAGTWPRTQEQRLAWARVLRADPGWLYFGAASQAPPPEGWRPPEELPGDEDGGASSTPLNPANTPVAGAGRARGGRRVSGSNGAG